MDDSLKTALARSGTTPDYTMGAVTQQTGIPAETLRSWERRHGFPDPVRTASNQRRYSGRDITAITWILEQTRAGQSVSTAIEILQRAIAGDGLAGLPPPGSTLPTSPRDSLLDALSSGDLEAAQSNWDDLVIALSPCAIGRALLAIHHDLARSKDAPALATAHAFLLRKATVLLDATLPDVGEPLVALITSGAPLADLPATVLAASLARAGARVRAPFAAITSLPAIGAIRDSGASRAALVDIDENDAGTLRALLPAIPLHRWNSSAESPDDVAATLISG